MSRTSKFAFALIALIGLSACNNSAKKAADEADRAQRIPLIAAEKSIEVDPDRIDVAVFLPDPSYDTSWTQTMGSADKVAGNRLGAVEFEIDWTKKVGKGASLKTPLSAPPVSNGETVFLIDARQSVHAVNLSNGSGVWTKELDPPRKLDKIAYGGGVALSNNMLVVASGYGYVIALDATSGDEMWRRDLLAPVTGAPTVDIDFVYVTTSNNEIYVLSRETGDVIWSDQAIAESARVLSAPSPALGNDVLVSPFSSGELIAFLPANGRRLWTASLTRGGRFTPISAINDIAGSPVVSDDAVIAASQSGVLASVDLQSGAVRWRQNFGSIQTPAVSGSFVFAVSTDSQIACFDRTDGAVVWVAELARFKNEKKRKDRVVWTGPVVASGKLILASSEGEIISVAPNTGEVVDRIKTGKTFFIPPIVAGERVLLLADNGELVSIR